MLQCSACQSQLESDAVVEQGVAYKRIIVCRLSIRGFGAAWFRFLGWEGGIEEKDAWEGREDQVRATM